jgi:phosphoenolpyruvate carboxylase
MVGEDARNFTEELLGRDIRQLGRLLGDTIRAQAGDQVFERIESIRKSCLGFRSGQERG